MPSATLQPRAKAPQHNRETRCLRLWKAIVELRTRLTDTEQRTRQTLQRFKHSIEPLERRYTRRIEQQIEQLQHHLRTVSLDTSSQSLLMLWVNQLLEALRYHPFADHDAVTRLQNAWRKSPSSASTSSDPQPQASGAGLDDEPEHQYKVEPDHNRHDREGESETTESKAQTRELPDEVLQDLDEALSPDRLFRKLAAALHPDRETDDEQRTVKHELMQQCLEARDRNDLPTLLELFDQHVGNLSDLFSQSDPQRLERVLLGIQRTLQLRLRHVLQQDPLSQQIIDRYNARDADETDRRFKQHEQALRNAIETADLELARLRTEDGLRNALQQRRAVEQDRLSIAELTGLSG